MRTVSKKNIPYAMAILQGIEDYRLKHRQNPKLKNIYRSIIRKGKKTEGSIYSMVWRMRKEYGLLEDLHMVDGLRITLNGYRFMTKYGEDLTELVDAPNLLRESVEVVQEPTVVMDNKDRLIEFMKWIYTLDDEEICGDGWKAKIVDKVETLLRNGERQ